MNLSKATSKLDDFYISSWEFFLNSASMGWQYAATIDSPFIAQKEHHFDLDISNLSKLKQPYPKVDQGTDLQRQWATFTASINDLNIKSNIPQCEQNSTDLNRSQPTVIIVGAGPVGLYLACSIKRFGIGKFNVVVVDNRMAVGMKRPIFNRDWVTIVRREELSNIVNEKYSNILTRFGRGEFTGLRICQIEEVIYRQCLDLGVKFLSGHDSELDGLVNNPNSILFDATGGRLITSERSNPSIHREDPLDSVEIIDPNIFRKFKNFGVNKPQSSRSSPLGLKAENQWLMPTIDGEIITCPSIKLSGVPIALIDRLLAWAYTNNLDNRFYIWPGMAKREVNESLILCNLEETEYNSLAESISNGAKDIGKLVAQLADPRFKFFQEIAISCREMGWPAKFEMPYKYCPYILPENGILREHNGKPIYPIGDSIFNGNPKMGNGLTAHLSFINGLAGVITNNI